MLAKLATLAISLVFISQSVAQSTDPQLWKPSPVTLALTVGQWLMKDREKIFYLRVEASGLDEPSALTSAFRLAVSRALGSLVLSETEIKNQEVVRHDIIAFSSGYVDDYKIVNRESNGNLIVLTVDVWVKHSSLSNRLLGTYTTSGKIDGSRLQARAETLTHSRNDGDKVLKAVLETFPTQAFILEQGPSRVYYNNQRQQQLELSFKLKWKHEYLQALNDALKEVSQNANAGDCVGPYARSCQYQGYVTIKARPGRHGWSRTAAFDDAITLNLIHQNLIESRPAVLITIDDRNGRRVWSGCQRWSELDNVMSGYVPNERLLQPTQNGVLINGYLTLDARVPFNLTATTPVLDQVKMEVVRTSQCPN